MTQSKDQFVVLGTDHPERSAVEKFIGTVFEKTYGAKVQHFAQTLLGIRGASGEWIAALGYTAATRNRLFVENYGGGSVEQQISGKLDTLVSRAQVVEVGNLAALGAGAARMLISSAIQYLYESGFSWVIFTATRSLLNSFARLDLRPISLATADPSRLPDQGRSWGSYYDKHPQIMAGSILLGYLSAGSRRQPEAMALAA